ncbi:hypothetical protein TRAPUB_11264 [Trametes pubescens]|uniref:Uncharacterized protein n=1 Tax=Trametes pubescens TaxID=154538 RepID=A0A1M2VX52_TRAPU|nr:hypothetical protein TRAPUB_11264 [Trametes pubescens]
MTLVQIGQNFERSACDDRDAIANDICKYTGPIAGLSAAVAAIRTSLPIARMGSLSSTNAPASVIMYSLVLLFVAWVAARRGKPIWMDPVPRSSAQGRTGRVASQDLEAKAGEKPVQ